MRGKGYDTVLLINILIYFELFLTRAIRKQAHVTFANLNQIDLRNWIVVAIDF